MMTVLITRADNATMQHGEPHHGYQVTVGPTMLLHHWPHSLALTNKIPQDQCCHFRLIFWLSVIPPRSSRPVYAITSVALLPWKDDTGPSILNVKDTKLFYGNYLYRNYHLKLYYLKIWIKQAAITVCVVWLLRSKVFNPRSRGNNHVLISLWSSGLVTLTVKPEALDSNPTRYK